MGNLYFVDVKIVGSKKWENIRVCESFNEAIDVAVKEHTKEHNSAVLKVRVIDRDFDSTVLMLDRTLFLKAK